MYADSKMDPAVNDRLNKAKEACDIINRYVFRGDKTDSKNTIARRTYWGNTIVWNTNYTYK